MRDVTYSQSHSLWVRQVSTHTPHAGRDVLWMIMIAGNTMFLLTRPMRDVTRADAGTKYKLVVSTHTPHAGRDSAVDDGDGR